MKKIDLPSGSSLEIYLLPFEEAAFLFRMFSKEMGDLNITIKDFAFLGSSKNIDEIEFGFQEFINLKGPLCSLLSNEKLINAGRSCLSKCIYNNLKITNTTFESEEARGDFYPCIFYAIKENVSPFFGNLLSYFLRK